MNGLGCGFHRDLEIPKLDVVAENDLPAILGKIIELDALPQVTVSWAVDLVPVAPVLANALRVRRMRAHAQEDEVTTGLMRVSTSENDGVTIRRLAPVVVATDHLRLAIGKERRQALLVLLAHVTRSPPSASSPRLRSDHRTRRTW